VVGESADDEWIIYQTPTSISGIGQDEGAIWAASRAGLLRWDRTTGELSQYLARHTPLPDNGVGALVSHEGKLYMSTDTAIVIFDGQGEWEIYTYDSIGLEIRYFDAPIAMVDGALWVGGEGTPQTFVYPSVERLVSRDDGVYVEARKVDWFSRESVNVRFSEGTWETIDGPIPTELVGSDGTWWKSEKVAMFEGGLLKSTDEGETWQRVLDGDSDIMPRLFDEQGRLYVTEDDAVLVLDGDQVVEEYRFGDVSPDLCYINLIERDDDGRMWIATDGWGLTMFDGELWHNWQPETTEGMREDAIRSLFIDGDKVYMGAYSSHGDAGVMIYDTDGDEWTSLWPDETELSGEVGAIAGDDQGRVFIVTEEGMVDIYDDGAWDHIPIEPIPECCILSASDALLDQRGNLWMATTGGFGLWKHDGDAWTRYIPSVDELAYLLDEPAEQVAKWFPPSESTPGSFPAHADALALDQQGQVWVATEDGIAVVRTDGSWEMVFVEGVPAGDQEFDNLAVDSEGRVWAVNCRALAVFDGSGWTVFPRTSIVDDCLGEGLGFDSQGRVWVGSTCGLAIRATTQ
jgi:ligand-binding sensor domain-containing protein